MANPGRDWKPPMPLFLGLDPRLIPPAPLHEIERITGRLHLSTYCQQEAEREYDACLRGEDYRFQTPETDAGGYVVLTPSPPRTGSGKTSGRPAFPVRKEPAPLRS